MSAGDIQVAIASDSTADMLPEQQAPFDAQ